MISEFLRVGFHPRPGDTRETWLSWANWLHNLGIDPITVPVDGWVLRLPPDEVAYLAYRKTRENVHLDADGVKVTFTSPERGGEPGKVTGYPATEVRRIKLNEPLPPFPE